MNVNKLLLQPMIDWANAITRGWDRFWFTPQQPHTLALIRILGGGMIFYTHLVWSLNLLAFLGPNGWLPTETVVLLKQNETGQVYSWSYLYYVDSPVLLWILHIAALIVLAMLTLGLYTRVTSILAFIITLSYCHRLEGSLFGLDQINALIATYLMIGQSGAVWSLDRWLALRRLPLPLGEGRREGVRLPIEPSVGTNIAIRLIQIHMCVIYLFGGIGKARGAVWWDGTALWLAFATLEYQSLDMVWTVHYPWLLATMAHITLFWELAYVFLVWPKLTRPIMLILAVLVHAGIGIAMGMKTFGLMMIFANLAFVSPEYVAATAAALGRMFSRKATPVDDARSEREPARRPLLAARVAHSSTAGNQ